jgi:hypothetical protein
MEGKKKYKNGEEKTGNGMVRWMLRMPYVAAGH